MGSAVKEIGMKPPANTNKDKKRVAERRKWTLHNMPLQDFTKTEDMVG